MTDPKALATIAGLFLIVAGVVLAVAEMKRSMTPSRFGRVHLVATYLGLAVILLGVLLLFGVMGIEFWK